MSSVATFSEPALATQSVYWGVWKTAGIEDQRQGTVQPDMGLICIIGPLVCTAEAATSGASTLGLHVRICYDGFQEPQDSSSIYHVEAQSPD